MLGAKLGVSEYLNRVCEDIQSMDPAQIEAVSDLIEGPPTTRGRFVFIIGNGGSGANASHFCEDLAKCTLRDFESQKRLKVLSLTDNVAAIMAWGNDEGYDRIFVEQLKNLASEGDLLLAISPGQQPQHPQVRSSWANEHGLDTVGITGYSGGKLRTLAHHNLHSPVDDMGIAESLHLVAFHWIIDDLYRRFSAKTLLSPGRIELNAWPSRGCWASRSAGRSCSSASGAAGATSWRSSGWTSTRHEGRPASASRSPRATSRSWPTRGWTPARSSRRASASADRWTRTADASNNPTRSMAGRTSCSPTGCARPW